MCGPASAALSSSAVARSTPDADVGSHATRASRAPPAVPLWRSTLEPLRLRVCSTTSLLPPLRLAETLWHHAMLPGDPPSHPRSARTQRPRIPDTLFAAEAPAERAEGGGASSSSAVDVEDGAPFCRICMVGDDAESGALCSLRCACKGGLRLVHAKCADAWFLLRGSGQCEVCKSNAWQLSEEALTVVAAIRARNAEIPQRVQGPAQGAPIGAPLWHWSRTEPLEWADPARSSRQRLLLADVCVLVALILAVLYELLARMRGWSASRLLVLCVSFFCAAALVSAFRTRVAHLFCWFESRLGVSFFTLLTLIALAAYVATAGMLA